MKSRISPILWSGLVMAVSLALALYVAVRNKLFLEANQDVMPHVSTGLGTSRF